VPTNVLEFGFVSQIVNVSVFLLAFSLAGLVLTWLVYPLSIFALAALRRALPRRLPETTPLVSVVVATWDNAAAIRRRVLNILASRYPADRIEIIAAIDFARRGATADELSDLDSRVRVVVGDAPGGKAASLNAGVRAARGELLVFADAAQSFDTDAVAELVAGLADPRFAAVSGALDVGTPGSFNLSDRYWTFERALRAAEARLHSAVGVTGAIYAMRRELWTPLPAGLILDDVYTPMRLVAAGGRIGFTTRARAHDPRRFAPADEYRRKVRTLTGVIQLCAWLPVVLNPMRNPIWIQFVCHKLLRLLTPYFLLLAVIGGAWTVATKIPFDILVRSLVPVLVIIAGGLMIRRVRDAAKSRLAWVFALQSAVVVATVNGARGRWDVW
jgi:cellulose synthase/poly-beta-1,6-N-acetylglucosamine synthase-like glycosyltransferase